VHVDLSLSGDVGPEQPGVLRGGTGEEDGFEFAHDARHRSVMRGSVVRAHAAETDDHLDVWATSTLDCEWWRVAAPGPPGQGERFFTLLRANGNTGMHRFVWSWSRDVAAVEFGDAIRVTLADGTIHEHRRVAAGWRIDLAVGTAHSSIDLAGVMVKETDDSAPAPTRQAPPLALHRSGEPTILALGEQHYRRSEESWRDAGEPRATVRIAWSHGMLQLLIEVAPSELTFAAADAVNRFDNEHPDINGDSVQLYLRTESGLSGWTLVPERSSANVRVRPLDGWLAEQLIRAHWAPTRDGYQMSIEAASSAPPLGIDVIINEMPRNRGRRRGQLVMSGAHGEFVYLRGDRHEADRLIPLRISDG
jgi:hypothetical protein